MRRPAAREERSRRTSALGATLAACAALSLAAGAAGGAGTISTYGGGYGSGNALQVAQHPVTIAASGTTLYVADSKYEAIRAIDTTTDLETVVATGFTELSGLTVDSAGTIYADDFKGLWRIDRTGARTLVAKAGGAWLAAGAAGTIYASGASGANTVGRIDPSGSITKFAGVGDASASGALGDGGPATQAELVLPTGLLVAPDGSVYVVDSLHGRVRKITPGGTISTVAGGGTGNGAGGPATGAQLSFSQEPSGCDRYGNCSKPFFAGGSLALGPDGSLYIAESLTGNRILKVDPAGTISTAVDLGGSKTLSSIAMVGQDLWIANGNSIERLTAAGQLQQEGGSTGATAGDGGLAVDAQLVPTSVAVDLQGNVYVASSGAVRKIDGAGKIASVGLPANFEAALVAIGPGGTLYAADTRHGKILAVGASGARRRVAAGLRYLSAMTVDRHGNVYALAGHPGSVREIGPGGRTTILLRSSPARAGPGGENGVGPHGPDFDLQILPDGGLAVDGAGNLYIAHGHVVWRLDRHRRLERIAGAPGKQGFGGFGGDGGPASKALLADVHGLALDAAGNLYVADTSNSRVRVIARDGRIETVAGGGKLGFGGDGGPATQAQLEFPHSVALDTHGHLFIADPGGNISDLSGGRIRVVNLKTH